MKFSQMFWSSYIALACSRHFYMRCNDIWAVYTLNTEYRNEESFLFPSQLLRLTKLVVLFSRHFV